MRLIILTTLLLLGGLAGGHVAADEDEAKSSGELWIENHRDPYQKKYFGEPINLSLRNADLVEVLRTFAEIGDFNLIISPAVSGTVTVELKGVPWDQALEQILKINRLGMEITGGRVEVAPGNSSRVFASMVTVSLELRYADAEVVARALRRPAAGVPSPGGKIKAEGAKLTIRDTRAALERFGKVLTYIDVPSAAGEDPESLEGRCVAEWNRRVPDRPIL